MTTVKELIKYLNTLSEDTEISREGVMSEHDGAASLVDSDALLAMGHPPWEYVICRLMGEAQERWGVCAEIPREEVVAWISSRMTHWTKAWPVPTANT